MQSNLKIQRQEQTYLRIQENHGSSTTSCTCLLAASLLNFSVMRKQIRSQMNCIKNVFGNSNFQTSLYYRWQNRATRCFTPTVLYTDVDDNGNVISWWLRPSPVYHNDRRPKLTAPERIELRGRWKSLEIAPFNKAHTSFYWRSIVILTYPTSIMRHRWGWPRWNFAVTFGIRKLESLGIVWRCLRDPTCSRF